MIETKMAQFGTTNMAAYLRKMAIDGYVVKLDFPSCRELVSLLRYSSNNLNQLTRRAPRNRPHLRKQIWRIFSKVRNGYGRRQRKSFHLLAALE